MGNKYFSKFAHTFCSGMFAHTFYSGKFAHAFCSSKFAHKFCFPMLKRKLFSYLLDKIYVILIFLSSIQHMLEIVKYANVVLT